MIELIIAIAIALILLAIVATQFRGAKNASYASEAKAAGSAYVQAVSQYQADNANHNPPAMTVEGPRNLLDKPYMRSQPDGVTSGRIGFHGSCGAPSGTAVGWVSYCPGTAPDFGVRVQWRANANAAWNPGCWMGRTAATPRC